MSSDENPAEDGGSIPVGLDMLIDRGQSRRQDPSQLRLIMTMVSKKPKWSSDPYHEQSWLKTPELKRPRGSLKAPFGAFPVAPDPDPSQPQAQHVSHLGLRIEAF